MKTNLIALHMLVALIAEVLSSLDRQEKEALFQRGSVIGASYVKYWPEYDQDCRRNDRNC